MSIILVLLHHRSLVSSCLAAWKRLSSSWSSYLYGVCVWEGRGESEGGKGSGVKPNVHVAFQVIHLEIAVAIRAAA